VKSHLRPGAHLIGNSAQDVADFFTGLAVRVLFKPFALSANRIDPQVQEPARVVLHGEAHKQALHGARLPGLARVKHQNLAKKEIQLLLFPTPQFRNDENSSSVWSANTCLENLNFV